MFIGIFTQGLKSCDQAVNFSSRSARGGSLVTARYGGGGTGVTLRVTSADNLVFSRWFSPQWQRPVEVPPPPTQQELLTGGRWGPAAVGRGGGVRGQRGHGTGKVIIEAPMWGIISPLQRQPLTSVGAAPMAPLFPSVRGLRRTRVNKVIPGVDQRKSTKLGPPFPLSSPCPAR
ncbi:hypothetical protein SRHO_G00283120 [Serrasalmus rhombeus]